MGSGYNRYCYSHKRHALRLLSQQQLDANYSLLEQLNEMMNDVDMHRGITELEENEGYLYYPHGHMCTRDIIASDENGVLYHRFTPQMLDSLYAIKAGDLKQLKRLHSESHGMGGYKMINVRLAIKYGHVNIVNYLLDDKWVNGNLIKAIGQLASPHTYQALQKTIHLNDQDVCYHTFKFYDYNSLNGELYFSGLDNLKLRGYLSPIAQILNK